MCKFFKENECTYHGKTCIFQSEECDDTSSVIEDITKALDAIVNGEGLTVPRIAVKVALNRIIDKYVVKYDIR